MQFGFHVSISGGISKAFDQALALDLLTFQIFSRNSRGWTTKPLDPGEQEEFLKRRRELHPRFKEILVHMPYLPNLSSSDPALSKKSLHSFTDEIQRCDQLEIGQLVTHLGSHKGSGVQAGIQNVAGQLEQVIAREFSTMILIENTAGSRNAVGSNFDDIGKIIDSLSDSKRIGVCLDTCHTFAAGYDLRTPEAIDDTFDEIRHAFGFNRLGAIHLNDSKGELGCGVDRHEHLGLGFIGLEGLKSFLTRKEVQGLPFIMETPVDETRDDVGNLRVARDLEKGLLPELERPPPSSKPRQKKLLME